MIKHRRVRVLLVLVLSWAVLTGVERWGGNGAAWTTAVRSGLIWACVVAGAWWFAEWTQFPRRRARTSTVGDSAAERKATRR